MGTYSLAEVRRIIDLAEQYQLEGRGIIREYLVSEIVEVYNGAGPDSWLPLGRETLTIFMSLFKPVILIHDLDFDRSDGADNTFLEVTARWKRNGRTILDAEYPFWTWKQLIPEYRRERAYWYGVMVLANQAVSGDQARQAWKAAFERNKSKKGN